MDWLDILQYLGPFLTAAAGIWGGLRIYIKRVLKAIDETADIATSSADIMKEIAEIPEKFLEMADVKDDGTIVFQPSKWAELKKEVNDVKGAADDWQVQVSEALDAFKAIFKKTEAK